MKQKHIYKAQIKNKYGVLLTLTHKNGVCYIAGGQYNSHFNCTVKMFVDIIETNRGTWI